MHVRFAESNFLHLLPLQHEAGDNDINDIETGLVEPLLHPSVEVPPLSRTIIETEHRGTDAGEVRDWEIMKSIVYGGLIESITSLGVVSSAAGAGADTCKFSLFFPSPDNIR